MKTGAESCFHFCLFLINSLEGSRNLISVYDIKEYHAAAVF